MAAVKAVLKTDLAGREVVTEAEGRRLFSPGRKVIAAGVQAGEDSKEKNEFNDPVPRLRESSEVQAAASEVRTKKAAHVRSGLFGSGLVKAGHGRPPACAPIMHNIPARACSAASLKRQLEAAASGSELNG
ncbi:MAG: hypothetical protein LBP22_03680 [Deltaproteobacteria bacterium]|jgi:hypothetical protein|nr:hypothetical protein [Deltaproteobacteria bacterium]